MSFICGVWHTQVTVSVSVFVEGAWGCLVQGLGIESNPVGALGITKGDAKKLSFWEEGIPGFPETGMSPVD